MSRRVLFALLAMGTAQAAVYLARPLTSYRLLGLGSDARDVGLVAAAFAVVPLFLAIPLGRHADRRQGRRLLTIGCGVQVLGCVSLAAAQSPLTLAGANAVLGVGHLGLALGAQTVIARESGDEHHDRHFGLLTAGISLGQLVGPLLAGLLLNGSEGSALAHASRNALFVAASIAALATLFAAVADRSAVAPSPPLPETTSGGLAAVLRTRGVPAGIFASIAVLSAADVFTAYMPVLGEERGIAPAVVGLLLATRAAASIVARVGLGPLVDLLGRERLILVSAVAAAVTLVALTFARDPVLLGVLSAVVGFGLGFGQPLSMTIVVQLVPAQIRATAVGVRLAGNRLGQVAIPVAAGLLAGSAGAQFVFWMLSGVLAASAVGIGQIKT